MISVPWIRRILRAALVLLSVPLVASASLPSFIVVPYGSDEHSIAADRGAGDVNLPDDVVFPDGVFFDERPDTTNADRTRKAKFLTSGITTNDPDATPGALAMQDKCYGSVQYRQGSYNREMYVPPEDVLPKRVLRIEGYVGSYPTYFTFGELVSLYGDYRRTTFCDEEGRCFLTNKDIWTVNFSRLPDLSCPDPIPATEYVRMIGSGLMPPYGRAGNVTSITANEDEQDKAGWWGDEMMRIATTNDTHFSNAAVAWYVGLHRLALYYADKARTDNRFWTAALHHEANAQHALTDLFAFGHVVVNRGQSSYLLQKFSTSGARFSSYLPGTDLRTHPTHLWMENVIRLGGGRRELCGQQASGTAFMAATRIRQGACPEGRVRMTTDLPPIEPMVGQRDDLMPTYPWVSVNPDALPWIARREEQHHTDFNDSGAWVENLAGEYFQIKGDYRLHPTAGPTQTLNIISKAVTESLQSLFDAYSSIEAGSSTVAEMAEPGSDFFRALKYIPVYIEKDDPQYSFFVGRWALYAGAVDELTGAHKLPEDWEDCKIPFVFGSLATYPPPSSAEPCDEAPERPIVALEPTLEVRVPTPESLGENSDYDPAPAEAHEGTRPLADLLVYDDIWAFFTPARDTAQEQFRWRIARNDSAVARSGIWDPINRQLTDTLALAGPDAPGMFAVHLGHLEDEGAGTYLVETCDLEDARSGTFGQLEGWDGCGAWKEESRFEVGNAVFHLQGIVTEQGAMEIEPWKNMSIPPGTFVLEQAGAAGATGQEGGGSREVVLEAAANWLQPVYSEGLSVVRPDSTFVFTAQANRVLADKGPETGESDLRVVVVEDDDRWEYYRGQEGPWIQGTATLVAPRTARTRITFSIPEVLDLQEDSIIGRVPARLETVTQASMSAGDQNPVQFQAVVRGLRPTAESPNREIAYDFEDWTRVESDQEVRNARRDQAPKSWNEIREEGEVERDVLAREGGWIGPGDGEKRFNLLLGSTWGYYGRIRGRPFGDVLRDDAIRWYLPIRVELMNQGATLYAFAVYAPEPGQYDGPLPRVPNPASDTTGTSVIAGNEGGPGDGRDPGDRGDPDDPGAGPTGPVDPAALNPDSPDVGAAIRRWIGVARPADTVDDDVSWHYDEWGRAVGARADFTASTGQPPDRAGRSPEAYVWGIRDELDSVDHCTLGEYVARTLGSESVDHCVGRYTPAPRIADFTDRPVADVVSELRDRGIEARVRMSGPATSASLAHTVTSQTPSAGTRVREGRTVELVIRGDFADLVVVPSVESETRAAAEARLSAAGLRADTRTGPAADSPDQAGIVIGQEPAAETQVQRGATVVLTLRGAFEPARGQDRQCGQLVSDGMRAHTAGNYDRALQLYAEARSLGCQNPRLDDANSQAAGAKADQERRERDDEIRRREEEDRRRREREEEDRRRRDEERRRAQAEAQRRNECNNLLDRAGEAYNGGRKRDALAIYRQAQQQGCQDYTNGDLDAFVRQLIDELNEEDRRNQMRPRCDALVNQGRRELNGGDYDAADGTLIQALDMGCPNSDARDLWDRASNCKLQLTIIRQARGWGSDTSLQEMMFRSCPGAQRHIDNLPPAQRDDPPPPDRGRTRNNQPPRLADPNVLARFCPRSVRYANTVLQFRSAGGEPIGSAFRCRYGAEPGQGAGTAFGWNYIREYRDDGYTHCRAQRTSTVRGWMNSSTHDMQVVVDQRIPNWEGLLQQLLNQGESAGVAVPCRR